MLTELHELILEAIADDLEYTDQDLARRFGETKSMMIEYLKDLEAHHLITTRPGFGRLVAIPTAKGLGEARKIRRR